MGWAQPRRRGRLPHSRHAALPGHPERLPRSPNGDGGILARGARLQRPAQVRNPLAALLAARAVCANLVAAGEWDAGRRLLKAFDEAVPNPPWQRRLGNVSDERFADALNALRALDARRAERACELTREHPAARLKRLESDPRDFAAVLSAIASATPTTATANDLVERASGARILDTEAIRDIRRQWETSVKRPTNPWFLSMALRIVRSWQRSERLGRLPSPPRLPGPRWPGGPSAAAWRTPLAPSA
jgi:hypothetical protein